MRDTMDMACDAGLVEPLKTGGSIWYPEKLADFAALVAAASAAKERDVIADEWSMCVQSDLEHGVKSLNETAAKEFHKNYPEISKFWGWLNERGRQ